MTIVLATSCLPANVLLWTNLVYWSIQTWLINYKQSIAYAMFTWFWYTLNKIHCDAWLANASALTTNTVHRVMFKKTMARINERNVIERRAKRRRMYGEINQQTCIMLKMPRDSSLEGDLAVQTLWNWFIHSCLFANLTTTIFRTSKQTIIIIDIEIHFKSGYIICC